MAISSLLDYFVVNSKQVLLAYIGKKGKAAEKIFDGISDKVKNISMDIYKIDSIDFINYIPVHTVFVFETVEYFKKGANNLNCGCEYDKRCKLLIYAPGLTENDIRENVLDGFKIDQAGFLLNEEENSIELVMSFMFTEKNCQHNQLMTINTFSTATMKWNNSNFYPEKYQNFYQCSLIVVEEERNVVDIATKIIDELARMFNFTPEYSHSDVDRENLFNEKTPSN